MKLKLKNIILLLLLTVLSFTPTKTHAFRNSTTASVSNLAIESKNEENISSGDSEDSDVFGFIKDNKNVKDFFYDGSALLYGGILLVLISIFGIFKTLKPKKRRKRKRSRSKSVNSRQINNRR